MFSGCKKLKTLKIKNFGTSNVKYMNGMFSGCLGFTTINLNVFNTKNVMYEFYVFWMFKFSIN